MKSLTGTLLAVLFFSSNSVSQQISRCASPLPTHSGCLTLNYDRFKDSTMASLQFLVVDKGTDKRIIFSVLSSYDGESPAGKDRTFAAALITVGTRIEAAQLSKLLYVLVDGKSRSTITFITTKADTDVATRLSQEQLISMMTAEELTRLAQAKSLEMKIGEDEFAFDDTMRLNLATFWSDYIVLPRLRP
jgi:hypothetical protein